jgi:hypothetical protein
VKKVEEKREKHVQEKLFPVSPHTLFFLRLMICVEVLN